MRDEGPLKWIGEARITRSDLSTASKILSMSSLMAHESFSQRPQPVQWPILMLPGNIRSGIEPAFQTASAARRHMEAVVPSGFALPQTISTRMNGVME